jgi:serine/threonine protein kinase
MDSSSSPKEKSSMEREIGNAALFAEEIVFSDTEKILFEEDLREGAGKRLKELMKNDPSKRYTPLRKLAEGGMKAIWEVEDRHTARTVAMALIQESRIASEEDIETFLYEARLTANLQHPNIIPVYDIALDPSGNPYFTMKALHGETLAEILEKLKAGDADYAARFGRTQLLFIFLETCNAIHYAHSRGVLHLDLKPSNIIVGEFGDVHVLDWGLSTLSTQAPEKDRLAWVELGHVPLENGQTLADYLESAAEKRRRRNMVGGTPGYMAPEQAQGAADRIDFRTDIYALGAILYEMLSFEMPITAKTVQEALQKTVRGEIVPPEKCSPNKRLPAALSAMAMKALSVKPEERYSSVSALVRDLQKYQEGFATTAENPTFFVHLALLVKRHKLAVGILAISLLIVGAILSHSFFQIRKSQQITAQALAELQKKNRYIATMAQEVAPDYLDLMRQKERDMDFAAAEHALETALAFDPALQDAWIWKGRFLLCQQKFTEAEKIFQNHHAPERLLKLAQKYQKFPPSKSFLPQLLEDFQHAGLESDLPRLFYTFNQSEPFSEAHFKSLTASLKKLNPRVQSLHFTPTKLSAGGWWIDLSDNPDLENLLPLCGIEIQRLDLSKSGSPPLDPIQKSTLKYLHLSQTSFNHLSEIGRFPNLQFLDISRTQIRNLSGILEYPHLKDLNISGIKDATIPPQLLWCRELRSITLSQKFRTDPTLQKLSNRGVFLFFTADESIE